MNEWLGRVVNSKAGRDKEKLFIVIGLHDDEHLLLADGKIRKTDKPKKKKVKHVRFTDICFEDIRTKLEKHDKITNAELRKALKTLEIVDLSDRTV